MGNMTDAYGSESELRTSRERKEGSGNYALGLKEQLIFPEIEYDKVDKIRGMDIVFVTTANTDEEAKEMLTLMGAPFAG